MECARGAKNGRLVFRHVMKTGGLAVRSFLQCVCEHNDCSVWRDDGSHGVAPWVADDVRHCPPSVCTTHGNGYDWSSQRRCGPSFANAKQFTVLRDPISRVWSFYNYLQRYYKPFQDNSLVSILRNDSKKDLNFGLPEEERCGHCLEQLRNAMAYGHFCGLDEPSCLLARQRRSSVALRERLLHAAMRIMDSMTAIFLFEDLNKLPDLFRFSSLPFHANVAGTASCSMGSDNPTTYNASAGMEPDEATREAIAKANHMDMILYDYSIQLPNVIRPSDWKMVSVVAGVAPLGWPSRRRTQMRTSHLPQLGRHV